MIQHESLYTLVINKKRVAVTKEVYKAYYSCRNREKYLDRLAVRNNLSLEEYLEKGIPVEYAIASAEDTLEEVIIRKEMTAKLARCLNLLGVQERRLIHALYIMGKSERQLSQETGIPPMTIHDRKRRILKRLKKLMEI
ncbi:MAG: DNA-directed RNA polymerase subunit beta [Gracilibacter sp. BRH_c7a]|nr:MAG: DNA-directed RNA polymerase subunit beta [Gracilibacter sp. BRH_c7a]